MCSYHHYGSVWLSLPQAYSSLQFQHVSIPAAAGRVHLLNVWWDGYNVFCPIGWSSGFSAGLNTIHPDWITLYFLWFTVQQIVDEWVYVWAYVLNPFVINFLSFWLASIRPLIWMIFSKMILLTCWQYMCLKLIRIVFVTMSLMTSYKCRNCFPFSIILIMLPMSRSWCLDKQLYCVGKY